MHDMNPDYKQFEILPAGDVTLDVSERDVPCYINKIFFRRPCHCTLRVGQTGETYLREFDGNIPSRALSYTVELVHNPDVTLDPDSKMLDPDPGFNTEALAAEADCPMDHYHIFEAGEHFIWFDVADLPCKLNDVEIVKPGRAFLCVDPEGNSTLYRGDHRRCSDVPNHFFKRLDEQNFHRPVEPDPKDVSLQAAENALAEARRIIASRDRVIAGQVEHVARMEIERDTWKAAHQAVLHALYDMGYKS